MDTVKVESVKKHGRNKLLIKTDAPFSTSGIVMDNVKYDVVSKLSRNRYVVRQSLEMASSPNRQYKPNMQTTIG